MTRQNRRRAAVSMLLAATMTAGTAVAAYADSAALSKNETVYVVTEADGQARDTIVSDKLTGSADLKTVKDASDLKDIEVVKGDAKMTKSGSSITWTTGGDEVCYQGKTDRKTPVTMDVTYYLDGKEISGTKLQGKSGNVKMVIKYTNNSNPCVPFIAVSGFAVTDGCLSDIKVSNGKVIEDGDKTLVACLAAPGIGTAVGQEAADKIGLNDAVTIEAKAEKFSVEEIMTAVTGELSGAIDTGKLNFNIDLGDGTKKLKDGANQVSNGAKELQNGSESLKSGIDQLSRSLMTSMAQLADGAGKLNAAIGTSDSEGLRKGAADLALGAGATKQYAEGTYKAVAGSKEILAQMKAAYPDIDFSALEQTLTQAEGAAQQTAGYAGAVADGSAKLQAGVGQLSQGMGQLVSSINSATSSDGQLAGGLSKLSNGASTLAGGQKKLAEGADKLAAGINTADKEIKKITDALTDDIDRIKGSLNAGRDYNNFSGIAGGMDGSVRFIYKTVLTESK